MDCGEKHSIIFEKTEGEALKALLFLIIMINKLDEKSTWIVLLNLMKVPT